MCFSETHVVALLFDLLRFAPLGIQFLRNRFDERLTAFTRGRTHHKERAIASKLGPKTCDQFFALIFGHQINLVEYHPARLFGELVVVLGKFSHQCSGFSH